MTTAIIKQGSCKVMISTQDTTIDELLAVIEQAIRGCGYSPQGALDFVFDDIDV